MLGWAASYLQGYLLFLFILASSRWLRKSLENSQALDARLHDKKHGKMFNILDTY